MDVIVIFSWMNENDILYHDYTANVTSMFFLTIYSQELLELAERKFLRQVSLYAESMESSPYPRLFLIDLISEDEKKLIRSKTNAAQDEVREAENKEEEEKRRTMTKENEAAEKGVRRI